MNDDKCPCCGKESMTGERSAFEKFHRDVFGQGTIDPSGVLFRTWQAACAWLTCNWQASTHLSQPAQAVDVDAVREVIAEMQIKAPTVKPKHLDNWAGRLTRALSGEKVDGWISTDVSRPERNTIAIYWHKSEYGGFPAIADEWRDEHHLAFASHWLPYRSPTQSTGEG